MRIDDPAQISDIYNHIYISPHLDDAALSCGGSIARHSAAGARALVVTLCTAAPDPDEAINRFAEGQHSRWGLAHTDAVSARLHEDDLAIERLGADSYWAGMRDAIYRRPDAYNSEESLFGPPDLADPLAEAVRALIADLRRRAPRAALYAPLGVGNHVDHQLVYAAARAAAGSEIAFYEDFPYVAAPGALERRMRVIEGAFVADVIVIDATLIRKLDAIEAYASQIGVLFGDVESMRRKVAAYAESLRPEGGAYAERLWLPVARA